MQSLDELIGQAAQIDCAHVLGWLDTMAEHLDRGTLDHLRKASHVISLTSSYNIETFITCVKLAGMLRSPGKIEDGDARGFSAARLRQGLDQ